MYDFRKYHLRSIHAENDAERAAINQELKDIYASLDAAEQLKFNQELEAFVAGQYKNIGSDYAAIKASGALN